MEAEYEQVLKINEMMWYMLYHRFQNANVTILLRHTSNTSSDRYLLRTRILFKKTPSRCEVLATSVCFLTNFGLLLELMIIADEWSCLYVSFVEGLQNNNHVSGIEKS